MGSSKPTLAAPQSNRVRLVVASSVMLTFISFWRAAAIVLNDLGSSAFYAGATAEQAIGKAAPWFILGVMLFSFAVRAVYVESCSMFVRGGVYRIVKEALGGTLAKVGEFDIDKCCSRIAKLLYERQVKRVPGLAVALWRRRNKSEPRSV